MDARFSFLFPILKKKGEIRAIVDMPKGSRNKFDFDPEIGLFELGSAMLAGVEFPLNSRLSLVPLAGTEILWIY